jgi:hypothetical protein
MKLIEFHPDKSDIERYPHFAMAERCWISEDNDIEVLLNHVENFVHLKIHRCDDSKIYGFYLLQDVKDAILGPNITAVQIFPRSDDLVDGSNTYHLWTWKGINEQLPNLHKMKKYS